MWLSGILNLVGWFSIAFAKVFSFFPQNNCSPSHPTISLRISSCLGSNIFLFFDELGSNIFHIQSKWENSSKKKKK